MKNGRPILITLICFLFLLLVACQDIPEKIPEPTTTPPATTIPQPSTTTPLATTAVTPTPIHPTNTPELPPTPTGYSLRPWTAEDANNLAQMLETYNDHSDQNNTAEIAALAYREAQLRFPDDPRLETWEFSEAVNQARSSDPNGPTRFETLLSDRLNSGQLSPDESILSNWLAQSPYQFVHQFEEIPAPAGYNKSYILALSSTYWGGGLTFWLLENNNEFTVSSLHNNLGDSGSSVYRFTVGTILDPDPPNIAITFGSQNESFITAKHIFVNVGIFPPTRLELGPERPFQFGSFTNLEFKIDEDGREKINIQMDQPAPCDHSLLTTYEWNGTWYEEVEAESEFYSSGDFDGCFYDWLTFSHYSSLSRIEQFAILESYENRSTNDENLSQIQGDQESRERFLVELALTHAVFGHVAQAQDYIQRLINAPSAGNSYWVVQGGIFLANYNTAENFYTACLQSAIYSCPIQEAFITSIASLPPMDWPDLRAQIDAFGTAVETAGSFDFDNDGQMEQWLAIRHNSTDAPELWLFSQSDQGWQAIYAGNIPSSQVSIQPAPLDPPLISPFQFESTIFINDGNPYAFYRHPVTNKAYVTEFFSHYAPPSNPLDDQYKVILERLWNGTNPAEIINDLLTFADTTTFQPTGDYFYHLGLAYELIGEDENAIANYLRASQDDCCPHALMTQAKLIPN